MRIRSPPTLIAWLNHHRSQKAPWCPSFSLAVRIFLLVRFSAAMYSNIQDCDEGMQSSPLFEPSTHASFSVQLLGTPPLPRSWPRLPDMGDFTDIRHSKLRVYCFTPRFGENPAAALWRRQGQWEWSILGLAAEGPHRRELLSSLSAGPSLSCQLSARQNSIGWFSRRSTGG